MRALVLATLALVSSAVVGCELEGPPASSSVERSGDIGQNEEEIIGGTPDTVNKSTVFIMNEQGGGCSGTLIAVNGDTGYILTAAHCATTEQGNTLVPVRDVIFADDYTNCYQGGNVNACDAAFDAAQTVRHPQWNPQELTHDFAIVSFTGAASLKSWVVPIATAPDGMASGTNVELSGFGRTPNNNSLRRHVTMPIDQVGSDGLSFDQTSGLGSCNGDSGGPAYTTSGTKRVVGVTSYGDQNCQQFGVYGRVQYVADWITQVTGQMVEQTCDSCWASAQNGACSGTLDACTGECEALLVCLNGCTTSSCQNKCFADHPQGEAGLNAIIGCLCGECSTLCADCNGNTSTTSSGPGAGSGGSNADGGEGAAASDDGNNNNNDDDGGSESTVVCAACTVGGETKTPWMPLLALAGLAGGLLARRRR